MCARAARIYNIYMYLFIRIIAIDNNQDNINKNKSNK